MRRIKDEGTFEPNLDAYAESVGTNRDSVTWTSRLKQWPVFAAATGSALALATPAGASIIYNQPEKTLTLAHCVGPSSCSEHISEFRFGVPNTTLGIVLRSFNTYNQHRGTAYANPGGPFKNPGKWGETANRNLKLLASGDPITAGGIQGALGVIHAHPAFTSNSQKFGTGLFQSGQPGFAEFQFHNGDLGWIRLEWTGTGGFPRSLKVIDWAYNNVPNASISAGEGTPSPTPEPGALALSVLAAGAAGVIAWRRARNGRRREA
jgi:hypothetical protein